MKKRLLSVLVLVLAGCGDVVSDPAQPAAPQVQPPTVIEVTDMSYRLLIDGMMCEGCAARVKGILEHLPGVMSADVDLEHHQATVKVKGGQKFDEAAARDALDKDSYTLKACAVAS